MTIGDTLNPSLTSGPTMVTNNALDTKFLLPSLNVIEKLDQELVLNYVKESSWRPLSTLILARPRECHISQTAAYKSHQRLNWQGISKLH
jgi:hypothetical protein